VKIRQSTTKSLLADFSGELIDASDPSFESARRVFSAEVDCRPELIACCSTTEDVQAAVLYAREHGPQLSVRSGGHSLAGWSMADGGLTLDVTALKSIEVDPAGHRVRVGAGVTWGQLDQETQRYGLAVTGASVSTTSVVGVTLGGGTGWLARKFGLSADNLRAAELITADGEIIHADEREHPELLWGLRGGGGNFGVVTWMDLALHQLASPILGGQLLYPRDRADGLLAFLRQFMPTAPDELGIGVAMTCAPQLPFVPEPIRGAPIIGMTICYAGEPARGAPVLDGLLAEFPPVLDTLAPRSYCEMQRILDPLVPAGRRYAAKAVHLHALGSDAIEVLIDHANAAPSPACEVIVIPGGGALKRIAPDTGPLAYHAAATIWILAAWDDSADAERHLAWAQAGAIALDPYTAGVCLNLTGQETAERIATAFGDGNYRRLREIKHAYDPANFFRSCHNIPPRQPNLGHPGPWACA
jgi:FAD/FMN-containing dehydrogenase